MSKARLPSLKSTACDHSTASNLSIGAATISMFSLIIVRPSTMGSIVNKEPNNPFKQPGRSKLKICISSLSLCIVVCVRTKYGTTAQHARRACVRYLSLSARNFVSNIRVISQNKSNGKDVHQDASENLFNVARDHERFHLHYLCLCFV